MTIFSAAIIVFEPLWASEEGNVHTNAATKELKKEAFTVKIQNIKEAINTQVTLISENKHQVKIRPSF